MYVSDYYYSALPTHWTKPGWNSDATKDYRTVINDNWMYMGYYELTTSPYTDTANNVFIVHMRGDMNNNYVYGYFAVRPTFNLNSNVKLVGGSGSKESPYRIS